ncbi:MAG: hypothetical protein ACREQA_24535 [Candidatus Binatia bacterium]
MASEIGVLVLHGIGIQKADFAEEFIAEMNDRLKDLGVAPDDVKWESGYWANLLNDREKELWEDLSRSNDLDWVTIRQFFINVFADAIAYQRKAGKKHDMYRDIHNRIHDHLVNLRTSLGNQDKPLVIVAHSLGSVIMSNYIWDEQTGKGLGKNSFERMEMLSGLVTFGSNIPLFTLALPDVVSIKFPPPQLPGNLKAKAKWLNFFDADDVLGYPLKPLSPSYEKAVSEDFEINVGGLFTSWNPISHTEYWTDNDFTEPVAELIRDVVLAA